MHKSKPWNSCVLEQKALEAARASAQTQPTLYVMYLFFFDPSPIAIMWRNLLTVFVNPSVEPSTVQSTFTAGRNDRQPIVALQSCDIYL